MDGDFTLNESQNTIFYKALQYLKYLINNEEERISKKQVLPN